MLNYLYEVNKVAQGHTLFATTQKVLATPAVVSQANVSAVLRAEER